MTREEANVVAGLFTTIGGFTRVEIEEWGFESGNYHVNLWCVNAAAGNRNLEIVRNAVGLKEAKLIAKVAKGRASERDRAALGRMAAERAVNRE